MRKEMALLALLCAFTSVACAEDHALLAGCLDPHQRGGMTFENANMLEIPNLTVRQGMNWSYPYHHIPVYGENQTIRGTFWGPDSLAGTRVRVSISTFDTSALLRDLQMTDNQSEREYDGSPIMLNDSGDASFALNGTARGIYVLSAIEESNLTLLFATPLLVTKRDLILELPDDLKAGDVLLVKADMPSAGNQSKIYAAIMISRQDYEDASMNLATEGPQGAMNTTLSLGDRSIQRPGWPSMSSDLLTNAFTLLPKNSAAGLQDSREASVELQLLTDGQWEKGSYILIAVAYSPKEGLIGLDQGVVEVI